MSRLIERKNKWFADFNNKEGKRIVRTTKVDIIPTPLPVGKTAARAKEDSKANAQLIASAMEEYELRGEKASDEALDLLSSKGLKKSSSDKESVESFLQKYIEVKSKVKRNIEADKKAVNLFLSFLDKKRTLPYDQISCEMANEFVEIQKIRVSLGTVNRYVISLSAAFNKAIHNDLLQRNPFRKVKLPNQRRKREHVRRAFTTDEIHRMINILPSRWVDLIKTCFFMGGQRLGDVINLKWNNIDWENKTFTITTLKTGERITNPITKGFEEILRLKYERRIDEYVFPDEAQIYRDSDNQTKKLSTEFTTLLKAHGFVKLENKVKDGDRRNMSPLSFHSLRSTFVTFCANNGVSPSLSMQIVGHNSTDIHDSYNRPTPDDKRGIFDNMGKEFNL